VGASRVVVYTWLVPEPREASSKGRRLWPGKPRAADRGATQRWKGLGTGLPVQMCESRGDREVVAGRRLQCSAVGRLMWWWALGKDPCGARMDLGN
jgi:hypothetical protein